MAKVNYNADDFIDKESFVTSLNEIATAIKSLDSNMNTFAKNLDKRLQSNTETINKSQKAIKDYQDSINNITPSTKGYTDAIAKAVEEINKQTNAQTKANEETKKAKKATDDLDSSLNGIKNKYKEVVNESSKLDANTQAFKDLQDEAKKLDREIKNLNSGFKAQRVVAEAAAGSYDELSRANTALKRELKSLPDVFGANAAAAKRMKEQIAANDKTLKEFDTTIGESFRNVGNYASAFDKFGGGFSEGLLGAFSVGGAAGLGFTAVSKGIELVVEGVTQAIETIKEINKEITKTSQLTDLTGKALQDATASVRSISQTFGQDFEKTLLVQNSLVKTFGLSFQEVGNIISIAFANGGDASGDLLDQLQEYDVFFKQAGFSAQEFASILTSATKQGVFSDKAADLVKEFDLRINEQTKSTSDALNAAFGKDFTKTLFKGINDGSITTKQALLTVTEEINKTGIAGAKLGAVMADVFGGPGEDVGKDFLKSLPDIITFAEKMAGTTKNLNLYLKEYGSTLNSAQKYLIENKIAQDELIKTQTELAASTGTLGNIFEKTSTYFKTLFTKGILEKVQYTNALISLFDTIQEKQEKQLQLLRDTAGVDLDAIADKIDEQIKKVLKAEEDLATLQQKSGKINPKLISDKLQELKFEKQKLDLLNKQADSIKAKNAPKTEKTKAEEDASPDKYKTVNQLIAERKVLQKELNIELAKADDLQRPQFIKDKKSEIKNINDLLNAEEQKYKTVNQLIAQRTKLENDLTIELSKQRENQSPAFLEKTRSEIENINKLLAERKTINPNFQLNDQPADISLDGNAKDKLVELGALAEEYKQKQLQGLITQQDLELSLFDVEKQRIEYQLANAAALNLNEEQIAKLKTEQILLNQKIAENPIIESLRIINGQESILREQKAKGQISDYDFELRLLEIKKKAIDLELANADKTKKSVEEINALKATQAEIDREIATKPLNTPIANAGKEALLSYIEDAAAAASAAAFLSSLQKGDTVGVAVKSAGEAFIAAKIISTFSKKKFAKGVIDLEGPGTATSDSIPSLLSRGESVITARGTDNAKNALTQINMGKLTDADIFENSKKENIQITSAKAKQDNLGMTKQELADVFANAVNKAVSEKIQVNQLSIETINGVLASVQQSQLQRQVTLFPDPTKPPTKIKNSAL